MSNPFRLVLRAVYRGFGPEARGQSGVAPRGVALPSLGATNGDMAEPGPAILRERAALLTLGNA
jgi:hypothetical protein